LQQSNGARLLLNRRLAQNHYRAKKSARAAMLKAPSESRSYRIFGSVDH
jgi:hypothetical protein